MEKSWETVTLTWVKDGTTIVNIDVPVVRLPDGDWHYSPEDLVGPLARALVKVDQVG